MHALAVFLVNRIVAKGAAFRDPGLDIFQKLPRPWITQLADFVRSMAIYAQGGFTHAPIAGSLMGTVFGEIILLPVATNADFVQLLGYISPVCGRKRRMRVFTHGGMALDAGITELAMD